MTPVFLSYVGGSAARIAWIKWYLDKVLRVSFVDYQDAATQHQGSAANALRQGLKRAGFFIQVLEETLGGVCPCVSPQPVLQWEFETFVQEHRGDCDRCLVINFCSGDAAVKEYVASILDRINPKQARDDKEMLGHVIAFLEPRRTKHDNLLVGLVDCDTIAELVDVAHALQKNIYEANDIIVEQKHLYTSPHGASLWQELIRVPTAPLRQVFDQYPFDNDANHHVMQAAQPLLSAGKKKLGPWIKALSTCAASPELNVVVLAGGECTRELKTVKWMRTNFHVQSVSVLLIDVSIYLLSLGGKKFVEAGGVEARVACAVVDMEKKPEAIAIARQRLMQDRPAVFIFVGPTLCNADDIMFVRRLWEQMKKDDVLLCEVILCPNDKTFEYAERHAEHDPRLRFITNPMASLDVVVDPSRFVEEANRHGNEFTSRIWFYRNENGERINLCLVKHLTKEYCERVFRDAGFAEVECVPHEYYVAGVRIRMGYVLAKRG